MLTEEVVKELQIPFTGYYVCFENLKLCAMRYWSLLHRNLPGSSCFTIPAAVTPAAAAHFPAQAGPSEESATLHPVMTSNTNSRPHYSLALGDFKPKGQVLQLSHGL